jgi:peptidoglycan biosynthesis protein MviN/MurJ (putative lipid II flippase)
VNQTSTTQLYPDSLTLSRRALSVLVKLNLLMGVFIAGLLVASLVAPGPVMRALGVRAPGDHSALTLGMRTIMVIGICGVAVSHIILTRLQSIVATVGSGDPFVVENADRLQTIAWSVLVLELMHAVVGIVAARVSTTSQPLDIHWSFSVTRWLVVLLLFVLARVFDQGARMREELAATV